MKKFDSKKSEARKSNKKKSDVEKFNFKEYYDNKSNSWKSYDRIVKAIWPKNPVGKKTFR